MWQKLVDVPDLVVQRGYVLKFPASYPFEDLVAMKVSGYPDNGKRLAAVSLITITDYNSGVNAYVLFPREVHAPGALTGDWLIKNWSKWVCHDGNVNDVWVREPLNAMVL